MRLDAAHPRRHPRASVPDLISLPARDSFPITLPSADSAFPHEFTSSGTLVLPSGSSATPLTPIPQPLTASPLSSLSSTGIVSSPSDGASSTPSSASTKPNHIPAIVSTLVPLLILVFSIIGVIHLRRCRGQKASQRLRANVESKSKSGPADPASSDAIFMDSALNSDPVPTKINPSERGQVQASVSDKSEAGPGDVVAAPEREHAAPYRTVIVGDGTSEGRMTPPPRSSRPLPKIPFLAS
ncbi:hypothetical protein DFH09DRAFT_392195 [Mycena vulgaris]|nr:hypothetical protein DFH09DRAFT_392195 [Mycena vulgaris]